jgi:hypothetical protein
MEDENAKLKRLLAETMLDNAVLKDIASKMVTSPADEKPSLTFVSRMSLASARACWYPVLRAPSHCTTEPRGLNLGRGRAGHAVQLGRTARGVAQLRRQDRRSWRPQSLGLSGDGDLRLGPHSL